MKVVLENNPYMVDPKRHNRRGSISFGTVLFVTSMVQTLTFFLHYFFDGSSQPQFRVAVGVVTASFFFLARPFHVGLSRVAVLVLVFVQALLVWGWPPDFEFFHATTLHTVFWTVFTSNVILVASLAFPRLSPAMVMKISMAILLPICVFRITLRAMLTPIILVSTSPVTTPDETLGWRMHPNRGYKIHYSIDSRGYFDREPRDGSLDLRICFPSMNGSENWKFKRPKDRGDPLEIEVFEAAAEAITPRILVEVGPVLRNRTYRVRLRSNASHPRGARISLVDARDERRISTIHNWPVESRVQEIEVDCCVSQTAEFAALSLDLNGGQGTICLVSASMVPLDGVNARMLEPPYSVYHQTNSAGFRDREHSLDRPEGVLRIAILSDSYGFGWGVKDHDHVSRKLEEYLNDPGGMLGPVEVLNFSVPGYDTRQQRMMFELVAEKYDPRVVLVLMVFNDNPVHEKVTLDEVVKRSFWSHFVPDPKLEEKELDYSGSCQELLALDSHCRSSGRLLMVSSFRNNAWEETRWHAMYDDVREKVGSRGVPVLDLGQAIGEGLGGDWKAGYVSVTEDVHPNERVHAIAAQALAEWIRGNSARILAPGQRENHSPGPPDISAPY